MKTDNDVSDPLPNVDGVSSYKVTDVNYRGVEDNADTLSP